MTSVRDTFTDSFLLEVAGDGAFARGAVYEREARVTITRGDSDRVEAIVRGTEPYPVALWIERGRPTWFCACPAALDDSLCKHAVATALTLSSHRPGPGIEPRTSQPPRSSTSATHLPPADVREWGKQVTKAFAAGGRFVDYRHAPSWAAGVHDMLDDLQCLLDAGQAEAVLKLSEQAHKRAETALNRIDDSDGWLTDISRRIADLHQAAAGIARPDPRPLARRLFDLETSSHTLDTFHRAAATYADVLGPHGIDRYRQFADEAWAAADHRDRWGRTFRIQQARIGVAIGARDPDELIEVKRDDLDTPLDYLEIVQLLVEVGRTAEAIDWAKQGLSQFADRWHQTPRLRDALADLLTVEARDVEVEDLYWDAFIRHPSLTGYIQLVEHASDPDAANERAIDHLQSRVGEATGDGRFIYPADTLIEILDHDGRDQDAWTLYKEHGCRHDLAVRLAKRRETGHPLDAIAVFERDVEQQIDRKNKTGYRAAVRQLGHIRTLATRAARPEAFEAILERVRTEHRLKRTLMQFLDAAKLD